MCADLVEELEQLGAGLVDGADDGSSSLSESFEQRDDLETRRAVQAAETHRHGKLVPAHTPAVLGRRAQQKDMAIDNN